MAVCNFTAIVGPLTSVCFATRKTVSSSVAGFNVTVPPMVRGGVEVCNVNGTELVLSIVVLVLLGTGSAPLNELLRDFFLDREAFDKWAHRYEDRLREEGSRDADRLVRMNRINPKYGLRNYLAQTAIEKAQQKDFPRSIGCSPCCKIPTPTSQTWTPTPPRLPTGASTYQSDASRKDLSRYLLRGGCFARHQ